MFFKCLLLLFCSVFIEAQFPRISPNCPWPYLDHGRVRTRQRSKLVKFLCLPRYELVGNRYATCRGGSWDVPVPVCVKPGCESFNVEHSVQIRGHHEAWVTVFCMPGYTLVGSAALYCNGANWNATIPKCVVSGSAASLSCDFEDTNLCGWMQDDLHDFDWTRINSKTPTSFLNTGPSYDHTFGKNGKGYYMYIESTSKLQNNTARLLSPVYDKTLSEDACFSFFYHMYGKGTGGLRVYQKPESVQMSDLLDLSHSEKQEYVIFEQWGNLGDFWYSAAPALKNYNDSFQIVIEGVRGNSFTSDIAIDDVALQRGENCTYFRNAGTTPVPPEAFESCAGRCSDPVPVPRGCECVATCYAKGRCCADYVELCVFGTNSTDNDNDDSSTEEQTETTSEKRTTVPSLPITTAIITKTSKTTTAPPTTTAATKPTTKLTTAPSTAKIITTPTAIITTKPTLKPTTQSTTKSTTKPPTAKTTVTPVATVTEKNKPKLQNVTTSTPKATSKPLENKPSTTLAPEVEDKQKANKEANVQKIITETVAEKTKSGAWKTTVITIVVLAILASIVYLGIASRTNAGRVAIARLTNTARDDSEVRYLNSNDDDL